MAAIEIRTPNEMPTKTTVLEQRSDYQRVRTEWSNGLIMIAEQDAGVVKPTFNYLLIDNGDNTYDIDYSRLNPNFTDEK